MSKFKSLKEYLEAAKEGGVDEQMQFDHLFSKVTESIIDSSGKQTMQLGKYISQRNEPFLFYKPYSKIFSIDIIDNK